MKQPNGANQGFETERWPAANALRGSMDAAEYPRVRLGAIFLEQISDAFDACQPGNGQLGADAMAATSSRVAETYLSLLRVNGKLGQGDSVRGVRVPHLETDYLPVDLPFNRNRWCVAELREDRYRKFGLPPTWNANFAWVDHKESST